MIDPSDLVRLADGTLPQDRLADLEARVAGDPALAAALERQRRAATVVAEAAGALEAPLALRERLAAKGSARVVRRRRAGWLAGLSGALAAVLLALVVALPGGAPGGPSVVQAAELGVRPAEDAPPPVDAARPALLALAADGVPFPNWARRFGWRATGTRTDRLDGRRAVTVFYEKAGRRIAYTIVSGKALGLPARKRASQVDGTSLAAFTSAGRTAVTWTRRGRTCVLSGDAVPALSRLAAWRADGAVPY